ncbi:conserved protein of unknown function [Nitrospira japonica]|uniref:Transcriptional regulator n=1 Tax=Nitrospira japonica TaxID=1325564 RepID=A0A1W1I2F1_9BACT|nr:conserved protein of unknown function [Nitrospira japonica]
MYSRSQTLRQQLSLLLTGTSRTARQLAALVSISERQVEEHLEHVVRSLARDYSRRFILRPSACHECGFAFRDRTRLTRPSRCPRCRSEAISAPEYMIETRT